MAELYDEQRVLWEYFETANEVREYDLYSDFSSAYIYRSLVQ